MEIESITGGIAKYYDSGMIFDWLGFAVVLILSGFCIYFCLRLIVSTAAEMMYERRLETQVLRAATKIEARMRSEREMGS